jgi:hypothetical protein
MPQSLLFLNLNVVGMWDIGLARGDEPIDDTDLIEIGVRVKHMTVIERAEGIPLYMSNLSYLLTFVG